MTGDSEGNGIKILEEIKVEYDRNGQEIIRFKLSPAFIQFMDNNPEWAEAVKMACRLDIDIDEERNRPHDDSCERGIFNLGYAIKTIN